MFNKVQEINWLALFWWSIKLRSELAGGYFTYVNHQPDTPVFIRVIDVFLIDAALLVFWQLVDHTERKALVDRVVYGLGLAVMFEKIALTHGS